MKIIDVTGEIRNGMWTFGSLFPKVTIEERSGVCEGFGDYFYTEFVGMHAQVGTYLETPAHFYGFENSYLVEDIPLERLYNVDCVVLKVPKDVSDPNAHIAITKEELLRAAEGVEIRPGDCIIVAVGWDRYWMDDEHFFPNSPYFTYDAMKWIIDQRPSILATDTPAWENLSDPGGFFPEFYAADILMLAPLYGLGQASNGRGKITILPLKVAGCAAAPCRVVLTQD